MRKPSPSSRSSAAQFAARDMVGDRLLTARRCSSLCDQRRLGLDRRAMRDAGEPHLAALADDPSRFHVPEMGASASLKPVDGQI